MVAVKSPTRQWMLIAPLNSWIALVHQFISILWIHELIIQLVKVLIARISKRWHQQLEPIQTHKKEHHKQIDKLVGGNSY